MHYINKPIVIMWLLQVYFFGFDKTLYFVLASISAASRYLFKFKPPPAKST